MFVGYQAWVDMMIFNMLDFDVILGMTCLSLYFVLLNYNAKIVTLEILDKLK